MSEVLTMLTIAEAAAKYNVAVHAMRTWVKCGDIPAVRCGKKYLICETNVREFLLNGNNQHSTPVEYGQIRRLN